MVVMKNGTVVHALPTTRPESSIEVGVTIEAIENQLATWTEPWAKLEIQVLDGAYLTKQSSELGKRSSVSHFSYSKWCQWVATENRDMDWARAAHAYQGESR